MNDYILPDGITENKAIIKIIGVGGGGCNAATRLYGEGLENVEFMVCNTDKAALDLSPIPEKIVLGTNLTRGGGAGMDPKVGREAALESIDELKKSLGPNIQVVFITAGMGGGTGTGAAPVIAQLAHEAGILTIAVLTYPEDSQIGFSQKAYEGIEEIRNYTDSIIIVDNQKMYDFYGDMEVTSAFEKADNVLDAAVRGIYEIITKPGYKNVDLQDVKTVMRNSGMALVGTGIADGEDRAFRAVESAFTSPLLKDFDVKTARNLIVNITYSKTSPLKMQELNVINDYITDLIGKSIKMKKDGLGIDNHLEDGSISVTVLATGIKVNNTPPPTTPLGDDEDTVELNAVTDNDSIPLSAGSTETLDETLRELDTEHIFYYEAGCDVAELTNETALARRERLRKQANR